jgi:hypothetical protein
MPEGFPEALFKKYAGYPGPVRRQMSQFGACSGNAENRFALAMFGASGADSRRMRDSNIYLFFFFAG